jgi:hypothetical protein
VPNRYDIDRCSNDFVSQFIRANEYPTDFPLAKSIKTNANTRMFEQLLGREPKARHGLVGGARIYSDKEPSHTIDIPNGLI